MKKKKQYSLNKTHMSTYEHDICEFRERLFMETKWFIAYWRNETIAI